MKAAFFSSARTWDGNQKNTLTLGADEFVKAS
jgi:hypothetical protein